MNKINLISLPNRYVGIKSIFLESVFRQYFNFIEYNETEKYDPSNSVFITNIFNGLDWLNNRANDGYCTVVDNLPEIAANTSHYRLLNPNWFWYRESLLGEYFGYNQYQPSKSYDKLAFMPINRIAPVRDYIVSTLAPYLDDFIYSYRTQSLPNDLNKTDNNWQRYFNPDWYNQTYFSLVIETSLTGTGFITEKSFKPIAYQHPFMIYGQPGTLASLKQLGFETYENLFDQSYDSENDYNKRLNIIIDNIRSFNRYPYDALTLEKTKHNHQLFFNTELVTNRIVTEIINPLLEYVNSYTS